MFFNKKQIHTKDKTNRTNSEKAVITIAFIFDINFKETAKYMLENNILEELYEVLPGKENYKEYIDLAKEHLKEMIIC